MRKLVGWMCVLSLIATLAGVAYWAHSTLAPFFHGAAVYDYSDPDPRGATASIGANGLRSPATRDILRGYVHRRPGATTYSGWRVLDGNVMSLVIGGERVSADLNLQVVLGAAVYDTSGRLVAACPDRLENHLSMIPDYEAQHIIRWLHKYGAPYTDETISSDWAGSLTAAGLPPRGNSHAYIYSIVLPNKAPVGLFVSAEIDSWNRQFIYMPNSLAHAYAARWKGLWVAGISLLIYLITLPAWVAMDARWRGTRSFAWTALIILTGPIGLAAYLIARPGPPKPCPNCGQRLQSGFKRCPSCGASFIVKCPSCGRKMEPGWQACPICAGDEHIAAQPSWQPAQSSAQPALSAHAAPAASDYPALSVRVSDAESGAPLGNVQVAIVGPVERQGITNPAGAFEGRGLQPGCYSVTATTTGRQPATVEADVGEGAAVSLAIGLTAIPANICGTVVDSKTGAPICGARVYLDSSRVDRSAVTQGDGAYGLDNVPPGPYTIAVEAAGYSGQTRLVQAAPGSRVNADIALDPDTRPADIRQEVTNDAN